MLILLAIESVICQEPSPITTTQNVPCVKVFREPPYPPIAAAKGVEGEVLVDVKIDAAGCVVATDVVSGHKLLRKVSSDAALRWRFNSVTDDTRLRAARLTFAFHINSDTFKENRSDAKKYRAVIFYSIIVD